MSRHSDAESTLFFDWDANMPERLFEFHIWFEPNGHAIVTVEDQNQYVLLNKELSEQLQKITNN